MLELRIEVDGSVGEARVRRVESGATSEASTRKRLAAEALAYAERLRFAAARRDGAPVAATVGFAVDIASEAPEAQASAQREPPTEASEADVAVPADLPADDEDPDVAVSADDEDPDDEGRPAEGSASEFGASAAVEAPVVERAAVSATDVELELGELRRVPRNGAQSMLTLAPGVLLTQHATEGHAMGMFLRGFDAGEGEDLEVLVDGMPINEVSNAHGHGYVDPLFAIPQVVHSLRITQGPFDPSQGDFATAGSVAYQLGVEERGLHLSLGYGRFDELRIASWWGPRQASEGTFAALAYNQGDGFGPNRSFRNGAALGRWEGESGSLRYSVLAFAATGTWRSAGVVRADDVALRRIPGCGESRDEQFFCTYDPNQGGSTSQGGLVGRLFRLRPTELSALTLFARMRSLRITENFTGFRTDPRTDGGPQRGDNLDQRYDAATFGARGRYRVSRAWLGFPQRLEAGIQLRYDDADTRADRRRDARSVPYRTEFDRRVRETLVGAYLRGDLRLTEWLAVLGGVRLDFFGFNVEDRNFPLMDDVGERLGRASFSASGVAASPRGTVRLALHEDLSLVISAGLGARSSDAAALSESEIAPFARVLALESGLVLDHDFDERWHLEARASAFTTRVSQDLVFDPSAGRNSVLGPSTRSGALGQGRLRMGSHLDVLASVTYTRSHLQPDGSRTLALFEGPRLPFIPSWVGRLDATGRLPLRLREQAVVLSAALGVQVVGERPLPLGDVADPFALLDVALGARWGLVELGAAVQNLADARYRSAELNYVSNFRDPALPPSMMAARHFAAGPPRTFLLTLSLHLDLARTPPESGDAAE